MSRDDPQKSPLGRRRGDHSVKCQNPNPDFVIPDNHLVDHNGNLKKRLSYLDGLLNKLDVKCISDSDGVAAAFGAGRIDRLPSETVKAAMTPVAKALLEHVDLISMQCRISLSKLAQLLNMSTCSAAEQQKAADNPAYSPKYSISRISHMIGGFGAKHQGLFQRLGWVYTHKDDQVWDGTGIHGTGQWTRKVYYLTEQFFIDVGTTAETLQAVRNSLLKHKQEKAILDGLPLKEVAKLTFDSLKKKVVVDWRNQYFEDKTIALRRQQIIRDRVRCSDQTVRQQAKDFVMKKVRKTKGVFSFSFEEIKRMINDEVNRINRINAALDNNSS
jgi:hypothetical protein